MTRSDHKTSSATGSRRDRRLRVLSTTDVEPAADLLARAFAHEPGKASLLPDEHERVRFLRHSARARLRAIVPFASAQGVDIDGDLAAVALWHPPGVQPSAAVVARAMLGGLLAEGLRVTSTAGRMTRSIWRDRRAAASVVRDRRAAVRAAARGPSWYLALIGTDSRYRRRGAARQLLEHVLGRCDVDRLAAWTETTDAQNVPLYERFGFVVVGHARGGDVMPDVWVMRREPRR